MPLLKVVTSAPAPPDPDALLQALSHLLARELGKPESYVMTCLEPRARMTFGGSAAPACQVEIASVGTLTRELTSQLSRSVTAEVSRALDVPADRVYIVFTDVRPHMWGYGGDTFA